MNQRHKRNLFRIFSTIYILVTCLPVFILIKAAQTWVGIGLGISAVLLLLIPLLLILYRIEQKQKVFLYIIGFILLIVVGFWNVAIFTAPDGRPDPNSPIQHRFFQEQEFNRFAITNIIPESDQVSWGFLLMQLIDPYIDAEQAGRVAPITMAHYREMEADPNFHELGSIMGLTYSGLFGRPTTGHYYLYIPQSAGEGPLPVLVFLHGSAGNFKSYTWIWSKFAEQEGFIIIAPSYGFGLWDQTGVETVIDSIEDAEQVANIDRSRIYLAGLSNGGIGVSRTAYSYPDMFRGLVFLSPVFEAIIDDAAFQEVWTERPVLVISGQDDRRIPLQYVENRVANMSDGGIDVTSSYFPNEDHFLVFSQPEAVSAVLSNWIDSID
jgi:pimeloyl-ACP methyl ester carboxylesterase